ncbi:MAG: hypothetical protein PF488_00610 [Patescibacteria group bacterium]|jgi:hypothetical protein|nr:hypothetical protein [Patescibacteria group bacterium]
MSNNKKSNTKEKSANNSPADFLASSISKSKKVKKEKNQDDEMREKIYSLEKDMIALQNKNIDLTKEIKDNTEYIKVYVKWKRIIAGVKWGVLILIVILGFLSFNYIFDYVKGSIDEVEGQVNNIVELKNSI